MAKIELTKEEQQQILQGLYVAMSQEFMRHHPTYKMFSDKLKAAEAASMEGELEA